MVSAIDCSVRSAVDRGVGLRGIRRFDGNPKPILLIPVALVPLQRRKASSVHGDTVVLHGAISKRIVCRATPADIDLAQEQCRDAVVNVLEEVPPIDAGS